MQNKSLAPALERGIDIIELIETNRDGFSFSEIYNKLKIPKPSLIRLLNILQKRKYLRVENKRYKLGLKLLSLGSAVHSSLNLREIARPFMEELLLKVNETVELEIFDEDSLLIIEKLESFDSPIRLFSKIGSRFTNLHVNAPGKVALAFLPEEISSKYLNTHNLVKQTPYTITDINKLKKELAKIKKEKVAFDFQEGRLEVSRVSSPIFNHNGEFCAAINIAGPYFRINQKNKSKFGNIVKEFASKISKELGYEKY
jgi:DNA-binding IclR family transcriptional regulator